MLAVQSSKSTVGSSNAATLKALLTCHWCMAKRRGCPFGGFWAWPEVNPGDSKDCTDFVTQPEAQAWHDFFSPFFGDVALLDSDGDGIACEGLAANSSD